MLREALHKWTNTMQYTYNTPYSTMNSNSRVTIHNRNLQISTVPTKRSCRNQVINRRLSKTKSRETGRPLKHSRYILQHFL